MLGAADHTHAPGGYACILHGVSKQHGRIPIGRTAPVLYHSLITEFQPLR